MDNVFTINNQEDKFISDVKNELIKCDNGNNSDIHIVFEGYLHNKSGFKLRVENIEVFNDNLIESWKTIIRKHKMDVDITADLSNAWVRITCRRITRYRRNIRERITSNISTIKCSEVPFMLIMYIFILFFIIWILWTRNAERFQN